MKKVILTIAMVALTFGMNAQLLSQNEVDDFTGDVIKRTKFYNIATTNVGKVNAKAIRINNSYYLSVYSTADLGCAGASDNYLMFIFTDGTKIKLDNDLYDIDCSDSAPSLFRLKDNSPLFNKVIEKIRFNQSDYYTDGTTSGSYSLAQIIGATK
tara:strand:- start:88 stop:552 length:465 start_codon:yes stop_codon:yes gene_type:complete